METARRHSTAALRIFSSLWAAGLLLGPLSGTAAAQQPPGSETESVTISTVELTPVSLSADYTLSGEVSQPEGDAQQQEVVASAGPLASSQIARVDFTSEIAVFGVTWDSAEIPPVKVEYRYLAGEVWSVWEELDVAANESNGTRSGTDPAFLTNATAVEVVAHDELGFAIPSLDLTIIDPQQGLEVTNSVAAAATVPIDLDNKLVAARYATGVSGLSINTRAAWGADESLLDWDPEPITIRGAVIHHTAGNNNYTQAEVPGIIRGIYWYHSQTLGWGDIGYNLLVDKYGGVWEGRAGGLTKATKGAHAYGANSETFGISVLGNFTAAAPPQVAQDALAKAIAWKLAIHGVTNTSGTIWVPGETLTGRTVQIVSGHRDIGATACPGDAFYPQLGSIRSAVVRYQSAYAQPIKRIYGDTRQMTAIAISKIAFPGTAKTVYLANQSTSVDAIAAGTVQDGPILLVSTDSVSAATKAEISRLKPTRVIAIGGTSTISDTTLVQAAQGRSTGRLGGKDRIETAIAVSKYVFPNSSASVYVADSLGATGDGSLDAVSGANLTDGPILLTPKGQTLDQRTKTEIVRLGGKVYELGGANLQTNGTRIAGTTRYGTSVEIAKRAYPGTVNTVYLVRGDIPVDALAAGVLTAGPRILIDPNGPSTATCDYLQQKKPQNVYFIGGVGSIENRVAYAAMWCAK